MASRVQVESKAARMRAVKAAEETARIESFLDRVKVDHSRMTQPEKIAAYWKLITYLRDNVDCSAVVAHD